MSLAFKLHGVRGSRPTQKLGFKAYGGNSTSMEFITGENFHLLLDGGSGLTHHGFNLGKNPDIKDFHILVTHTHWDHILGFPYFEPLYDANNNITFHGPTTSKGSLEQLFKHLLKQKNLPIPIKEIKANIKFEPVGPNETFSIGANIEVSTFQLNHQGVTLGYRVTNDKKSICVITDNAPIENDNHLGEGMEKFDPAKQSRFIKTFNDGLAKFIAKTDLVVFDTHFTEAGLKPSWGHSTPPRALEICKKAQVKKLILFHHAPEDTDADVTAKEKSVAADAKKAGIVVEAAVEGKLCLIK